MIRYREGRLQLIVNRASAAFRKVHEGTASPADLRLTSAVSRNNCPRIFSLLTESNAALCIAESEDLTTPKIVTADFGYFRSRRGDYTNREIRDLAGFIRDPAGKWSEAFVYFKHKETAAGPGFTRALVKAPMD